ncbi:DUF6382 domain-containing protein [Paenibacillus phocaensis]|uniref:DUF6382 domain-containing protein n=1 Tax=Paenibacillus phocaensis TaxID=1776378 RepID=UPI000839B6DC|nr:DUF6382 domain-containing protein [Paenibacillus phocaensis]
MPELVADFVRDGGTFMILEDKEGLRPEDLNRVQRSMLTAVAVPNLLRLDICEIDYRISLHYDITGKRMLSQCLRSDRISMPEFYGILLQIVGVLEDSKRYMLSPSCYLLDEAHIFVEEPLSSGTLYFTYIPWKIAPSATSLSQALLSLITRLLTCVARVEGEGIPQLVRLCGDELFSLGELKKMLLRLLSDDPDAKPGMQEAAREGHSAGNEPSPRHSASRLPESRSSELLGRTPRSAVVKEYLPSREPAAAGAWASAESPELPEIREKWPGLDEETMPNKPSLKTTYLVLSFLLVDALCWKLLYFDRTGALGLALCAAITALLGAGGFMLWRKLRSGSANLEEGSPTLPEEAPELLGVSGLLGLSEGREVGAALSNRYPDVSERLNPRLEPSVAGIPDPAPASEAEISPPTMLLSRSMLQGKDNPLPDRVPRYYLDRSEPAGGATERIPLTPGSFVIGRSEDIAQYVESTAGVSRAHVEILVTSQGCVLKDLGSKNGTRLNGENVAPYKEYPLQADDVFILAETSFKLGADAA